MEVRLTQALGDVKVAADDVARESARRRLQMADVPCAPGCSGCCRRLVRLSVAEAMILYEYLLREGKWEDVRSAARSVDETARKASPMAWFKMNIPCPVLQKDICAAYPVRPPACSAHFVRSSPDACNPWHEGSEEFVPADQADLVAKFRKRLEGALEGHGILRVELPLPTALLLAERVSLNTGLDVAKAVSILFNET